MKLKPGFYFENDGTIWLVYPDGKTSAQFLNEYEEYFWATLMSDDYFKSAKKTYIGL